MSNYYPSIVISGTETFVLREGDEAASAQVIDGAKLYVLPDAAVESAALLTTDRDKDYSSLYVAGGEIGYVGVTIAGYIELSLGAVLQRLELTRRSYANIVIADATLSSALVMSGCGMDVTLVGGRIEASIYNNGWLNLGTSDTSFDKIAVLHYYDSTKYIAASGAECVTVVRSGKDLEYTEIDGLRIDSSLVVGGFYDYGIAFSNIEIVSGAVLTMLFGKIDNAFLASGTSVNVYLSLPEYLNPYVVANNLVMESGAVMNGDMYCNSYDSSATISYYTDYVRRVSDGYYRRALFTQLRNVIWREDNSEPIIIEGTAEYFTNASPAGKVWVESGSTMRHTVFEHDTENEVLAGCSLSDTRLMKDATLTIGESAVASDTYVYGGVISFSGATLSGESVMGGTMVLSGAVVNTGDLSLALYYDLPESGFIVNGDRLSGGFGVDASTFSTGNFILATNLTSASSSLELYMGEGKSPLSLYVGWDKVIDGTTYRYSASGGSMLLSIGGSYEERHGNIIDGNAYLVAGNCRVRSLICGAAENIAGDVCASIELLDSASPCNIYGGGNNVSVGGKVFFDLYGGRSTGTIYGGTRASTGGSATVAGEIVMNVSDLRQTNNLRLITDGETAWLVGGGAAATGGALRSADVSITVDGSWVGHLVGGAEATGNGSVAAVGDVNITLKDTNCSGDVYGGGYAYNGGVSTVESVSMTLDGSEGMIYVVGTVYGGGANPSRASLGGSSVVAGDAVITLIGYAENFLMSTISGDGKAIGSVQGERRLVLENFTGELAANIINFDTIEFSEATDAVLSKVSASHLAFSTDWSDKPCVTLEDFTFVGDCGIDVYMSYFFDTQQLVYCDDTSAFEEAAVNFWDGDRLIDTVGIGDKFSYKGRSYQVVINDDGLGLKV